LYCAGEFWRNVKQYRISGKFSLIGLECMDAIGRLSSIYRVGQKKVSQIIFAITVYCQPISIIFGTYTL